MRSLVSDIWNSITSSRRYANPARLVHDPTAAAQINIFAPFGMAGDRCLIDVDEAPPARATAAKPLHKIRIVRAYATATAPQPIIPCLSGTPIQGIVDDAREETFDGRAFAHPFAIDMSVRLKGAEDGFAR